MTWLVGWLFYLIVGCTCLLSQFRNLDQAYTSSTRYQVYTMCLFLHNMLIIRLLFSSTNEILLAIVLFTTFGLTYVDNMVDSLLVTSKYSPRIFPGRSANLVRNDFHIPGTFGPTYVDKMIDSLLIKSKYSPRSFTGRRANLVRNNFYISGTWYIFYIKKKGKRLNRVYPVSYTHLTLPTIYSV